MLGRRRTSRGVDRLDRLEQLAGARVGRLAAVDDRRDAEVAEDRGQPVAGDDGDDAERGRAVASGGRLAGAAPVAVACRRAAPVAPAARRRRSPVNAAACVSRTSRAWLSRFSTLIRLSAPELSP